MSATDHRERLRAGEQRGARNGRDRFLPSVDEVGVLLARLRVGTHAEEAVLRLERNADAGRKVVRGHRGDANAEVAVHAVLELKRCPADDALAALSGLRNGLRVVCRAHVECLALNALLELLSLDDALDIDARDVDLVGVELALLDDLLHLGNGDLAGGGHVGVEVPRRAPEDEVAGRVGLPGLDEGIVSEDTLLEDVLAAVDLAHLLRL
mmetsp:Transcript_4092/g.14449  ORF Transcript_4092/g.14449 Transcript_4092/m.14449 type:complete len:210 (-) Transcript_4092:577-1206(-)